MQYNAIQYTTLHYNTIPYPTLPYHSLPYHTIPYHTITYIHTYMQPPTNPPKIIFHCYLQCFNDTLPVRYYIYSKPVYKDFSQNLESWILDWKSKVFLRILNLESWIGIQKVFLRILNLESQKLCKVCKAFLDIEYTDWFIIHALSLLSLPIPQNNRTEKAGILGFFVFCCFLLMFFCLGLAQINPNQIWIILLLRHHVCTKCTPYRPLLKKMFVW